MKLKIYLLLIILGGLLTAGTADAQQLPEIREEQLPVHPRILLQKGEESSIKNAIAQDSTWRKMHAALLHTADGMLLEPLPERVLNGRRLLSVSREALKHLFYLSYAWRLSGEEKYLKRAEEELLAVAAFSDWNPSHFLDVAEMTMGVAIAYDWLYHALSDSSRQLVKDAILKKGIEPSLDPNNNGWLRETHNWNQVGNAGMVFGALAIYEDRPELARQVIERAIETVKLPMQDYGPDGAYPEGYSYWGYGTSFNVMLLAALQKMWGHDFGLSEQPGFLETAGYMLHMTGTSGKAFNYSDSGSGGGPKPAMFWFASKLKDPSLLWIEKKKIMDIKADDEMRDRLMPAMMIWSSGISMNQITPPRDKLWAGGGKTPVALMRSSWTDPNAIYVGLKGGSPAINHGHMDVGSFVMDALGTRWAMDFGSENYTALEAAGVDLWNRAQNSQRWQIFRYHNLAHNTLTVNNQPQRTEAFSPLTAWLVKPDFVYAVVDISALYEPLLEAKRGIAIKDDRYVVVRDELTAAENGTCIRWTFLTAADVEIKGKNTAILKKDGKQLLMKVVSPKNVDLQTWSTVSPNSYDSENPGTVRTGFEVRARKGKKTVLEVVLIPMPDNMTKKISSVPLEDWGE